MVAAEAVPHVSNYQRLYLLPEVHQLNLLKGEYLKIVTQKHKLMEGMNRIIMRILFVLLRIGDHYILQVKYVM